MSDYVTTWSTIINNACDLQYPAELNYLLNKLLIKCKTHYSFNGHTYTAIKVNPYTAIETNNITRQQRTLKSSVCVLIAL